MKSILMSIQPKWCEKIISGEKTIEVRKTAPKPPFKVVVYCTKAPAGSYKGNLYINPPNQRKEIGVADWWPERKYELSINGGYLRFNAFLAHGKVIGEFVCDKVDTISVHNNTVYSVNNLFADKLKNMCLTVAELKEYLGAKNNGYAIGITNLKVYDKPRELGEFYGYNKELEQRFIDGENYCCYDAKNEYGDAMTECDGENIHNCYRCWEEWSGWCHRITRPPQSWQYIQELED